MDQVRPGRGDIQSTGSVDQIHPRHFNPSKIISRCNGSATSFERRSIHQSNQVSYQDGSWRIPPLLFPCQNLPHTNSVEDKLVKDSGPVGGPHLGTTSPAPSRNPTPDLAPTLIPTPVPVQIPAPAATNDLFKQFIKVYLETNQGPK